MDLLTNPMTTNLLSITAYYNVYKQNIKTEEDFFFYIKKPQNEIQSPQVTYEALQGLVSCHHLFALISLLPWSSCPWPPCWSFNTSDMVLPLYLWTCCSIGLEKPLPQIKGLICPLLHSSLLSLLTSFQFIITYHSFRRPSKIISSKIDPPTPCSHLLSSVLWFAFSSP